MRLYTRADATAIDDPEYGRFEADSDGTFKLPDEMADRLLRFHHRGEPLWETETQRGKRLKTEDLDRRRDPAALLDAVQQILMAAQIAQTAQATAVAAAPQAAAAVESASEADAEPDTAPAKRTSKRTVSGPAAE